jgi:two-component system secretion response regulator SsrB
MKTLNEWKEEWFAMSRLHSADTDWDEQDELADEKSNYLNLDSPAGYSTTFVDLRQPKFKLHYGVHDNWLEHKAVCMEEPSNFDYLLDLTHKDDRIFSLETELIGYDSMMLLKPSERKTFWMKYHRRFRDKTGKYIIYLITITVYKLDEKDHPCFMKIKTERLPITYQPEQTHYREFSHSVGNSKVKTCIFKKLSPREKEVLELAHEGLQTKDIALKLGTSYNTVKNQRKMILKKLGTDNMNMAYEVAKKLMMI